MLAAGMVDVTRRLEERGRRIGRVVLRVVAGPDRGKKIVRHDLGPDTVQLLFGGRNPDNDIVLTDEHASDVHFELAVGSDAVVLRDLGSTNGVRLHGIRVDRAWLTPNAVFQVGQSHMSLEVADTVDEDLASDHQFAELHGRSVPMRELFARLEKIARRSELPQGDKLRVLIAGETGTGKELVARALHANSRRRGGPFVVRDCSTIPRELAESVLFGHARGSFTGADRERPGCFEEAGGGTLFLDEIGELPLELQAKLLRVLQEETVTRVGEHFTRRVDVRILCATHRDLQRMVSEGTFRQDLYFRLAGLQLRLPSLRERGDDVLHLADLFLRRIADETHEVYILHADVAAALCAHPWPGNVRELRAVLDRATVMADTGTITVADLGLDSVAPAGIDALLHLPLAAAVAGFERRYYDALLARHPTKVKAAAAAGITYEGLRQALRRLAATPLQP